MVISAARSTARPSCCTSASTRGGAHRDRARPRHARLARADDARAPARRRPQGPDPLRVALIGGGPLPAGARRAGAGGGHPGRPDLRHDGGLLAGRDLASGRAGDGRPPAARHAVDDRPRRRDPRRRPDRRARRARPTAGCTPATAARLDAQGRLTVTGRKADTIVTGGENVAPAEVEAALLAASGGRRRRRPRPPTRSGGGGRRDRRLHDGSRAEAEELRAHVASQLARFKVPKEIAFARDSRAPPRASCCAASCNDPRTTTPTTATRRAARRRARALGARRRRLARAQRALPGGRDARLAVARRGDRAAAGPARARARRGRGGDGLPRGRADRARAAR